MRGEPKVTSSHLQRTAICYIRQSSLVQVREHTESTARQYGLAALAEVVRSRVEISRRLREVLGEISAINLELLARRELD